MQTQILKKYIQDDYFVNFAIYLRDFEYLNQFDSYNFDWLGIALAFS